MYSLDITKSADIGPIHFTRLRYSHVALRTLRLLWLEFRMWDAWDLHVRGIQITSFIFKRRDAVALKTFVSLRGSVSGFSTIIYVYNLPFTSEELQMKVPQVFA